MYVPEFGEQLMVDVATTVDMTHEDTAGVAEVLVCAEADVPARLADFGNAALREYVEMMLGEAQTSGRRY